MKNKLRKAIATRIPDTDSDFDSDKDKKKSKDKPKKKKPVDWGDLWGK